jgi:hypothetical protein
MKLLRSKDRKVTNLSTPNGKQAKIANTFGLPSGKEYSCPGMTSVCEKICYAGKLENVFPSVGRMLLKNWAIVKQANLNELTALLDDMIVSFKTECEKNNVEKSFRIHWDGDFFSLLYIIAWRKVILKHSDVQFWCYTRVATAVPALYNLPNLSLYFSTDSENVPVAIRLHAMYNVKLAMLDETFEEASEALSKAINKRGTKCPENNKKIPLISNKGGACITCGLCVENRNHVLFSISKK